MVLYLSLFRFMKPSDNEIYYFKKDSKSHQPFTNLFAIFGSIGSKSLEKSGIYCFLSLLKTGCSRFYHTAIPVSGSWITRT